MASRIEAACLEVISCDCGEAHYIDEPCPRCTRGSVAALEERLAASLRREQFLLAFADRLLTRLATSMVDSGGA